MQRLSQNWSMTTRLDINKELVLDDEGGLQVMPTLHYAAALGRLEIMSEVLSAGCNVNQRTTPTAHYPAPLTALHLACQHRDQNTSLSMVNKLLANGAEINPGRFSRSPLYFAARQGHTEVVSVLCARGAHVNDSRKEHRDRYSRPHQHAETEREGAHASNTDVCVNNDTGTELSAHFEETPLHSAALHGHSEVIRILCSYGADVNSRNECGDTPVHSAVAEMEMEALFSLCELGADVNWVTSYQETPLHCAARKGSMEITAALCAHGGCINSADAHGNTPLHIAAENGSVEILEYFLSRPECKDLKNTEGNAALQHAIHRGLADRQGPKHLWIGRKPFWVRISEMLNVVTILIRAGWQADPNPMTMLLEKMELIFRTFPHDDIHRPDQEFCDCLTLLLTTGCPTEEKDTKLMKSDTLQTLLKSRGILQYVQDKAGPNTLGHSCRLAIRSSTCKPLTAHLPATGLPPALMKYILFETEELISLQEAL